MNRRQFVTLSSAAAAGGLLTNRSIVAAEEGTGMAPLPVGGPAIRDVIARLVARGGGPIADTVDTAKSGDASQPLRGIVTTFMANVETIRRAAALGANLIVTHEPTFYNHRDETDWLAGDPVFEYKRQLIERSGIVVFRYHDFLHRAAPDVVYQATVERLGWQALGARSEGDVFELPETPLAELVETVREKLAAPAVRWVGDPAMPCRRVGLALGAPGGRRQIEMMQEGALDLLVAGEIAEWEVSEYTRDAISAGLQKALLVVGHAPSEQLGMELLARQLHNEYPGVAVAYEAAPAPFRYA